MRKYRHKPSGATFETDMEMPATEWEPIDGETEPPEKEPAAPRKRTRKQTAPKEQ